MKTLGSFTIESLGVDYPNYFQGYGVAHSKFSDCCYGVGDTEAEALDDCIEQLSQIIDLTAEAEERIREEFGAPSEESANEWEEEGSSEAPYFHVGIRWNIREEERLARVKALGVEPLTYNSYECLEDRPSNGFPRAWGNVRRLDNYKASYRDFKRSEWPNSAKSYYAGLSDDKLASEERYFFVPCASGSDYSGSTVERSNHKVFLETYETYKANYVHNVVGSYGTYTVAVGLTGLLSADDDTFDEICNVIAGLQNYPVIDKQELSRLELDLSVDAWRDWGDFDFRRALTQRFGEREWKDDLSQSFEKARQAANEDWFSEEGGGMYIRIERIVDKISNADALGMEQ